MSKRQSIIALSTCEAKYMAASSFVCEGIWLKNLLNEFDHPQEKSIIIYVSINMKYRFLRDYMKQKVVKL